MYTHTHTHTNKHTHTHTHTHTHSGKKSADKKEALKGKDIARDTKRELKSMGY